MDETHGATAYDHLRRYLHSSTEPSDIEDLFDRDLPSDEDDISLSWFSSPDASPVSYADYLSTLTDAQPIPPNDPIAPFIPQLAPGWTSEDDEYLLRAPATVHFSAIDMRRIRFPYRSDVEISTRYSYLKHKFSCPDQSIFLSNSLKIREDLIKYLYPNETSRPEHIKFRDEIRLDHMYGIFPLHKVSGFVKVNHTPIPMIVFDTQDSTATLFHNDLVMLTSKLWV